MRVATKLSLALGLLVAIVLVVVVVHVRTLRSVVSTSHVISEVSGRVMLSTRAQLERLTQIDESASKYLITRDRGYLERMEAVQRDFAVDLARLARLPLAAPERREVSELTRLWRAYEARVDHFPGGAGEGGAPGDAALRALRTDLSALGQQVRQVGEASQEAMDAALASSVSIARRAERVSWGALSAGLLLSIAVSIWIVRSISGALRRLREGTREVASGNFAFRIVSNRSDEFAELAHEFNGMSHRLGEFDRMKREFISNISHDLKTPLASMQEITRALLDEVPGPLTPQQTRLLDLHFQSGHRLGSMIADLLDLSAMEAGALELRRARYELADLVRQALDAVEPARAMRRVQLSVRLPDQPVQLDCDGQRVQQLFVNVLDNAIKFAPVGGNVGVDASVHRHRPAAIPEERWRAVLRGSRGDGAVLVAVTDSGPGIPASERERVFERFVQAERDRGDRRRGVGLGLAICREIVDAHGGSMWAGQSPEGGCAIFVLFPPVLGDAVPVATLLQRDLAPS